MNAMHDAKHKDIRTLLPASVETAQMKIREKLPRLRKKSKQIRKRGSAQHTSHVESVHIKVQESLACLANQSKFQMRVDSVICVPSCARMRSSSLRCIPREVLYQRVYEKTNEKLFDMISAQEELQKAPAADIARGLVEAEKQVRHVVRAQDSRREARRDQPAAS